MALRAFKATFPAAIDSEDTVGNEERPPEAGLVTMEDVKEYLRNSLIVDWQHERTAIRWASKAWRCMSNNLSNCPRTNAVGDQERPCAVR
jgi:hypothetical protein